MPHVANYIHPYKDEFSTLKHSGNQLIRKKSTILLIILMRWLMDNTYRELEHKYDNKFLNHMDHYQHHTYFILFNNCLYLI